MTLKDRLAAAAILTLGVGLPSSAAAQIPDSTVPLQTVVSETNRFRVEYAEYVNNKDLTRLAAMYDAEAIVTFEDGVTRIGKDAIVAVLKERMPDHPHMVIASENLIAYGPTAIDMGSVKLHPTGGGEIVNKYLVVLRRRMGVWSIVRLAVTPTGK